MICHGHINIITETNHVCTKECTFRYFALSLYADDLRASE